MNNHIDELTNSALFKGIAPKNIRPMLQCVGGYRKDYKKGDYISFLNDNIKTVGIVLHGNIHMLKEDAHGNKNIVSQIKTDQLIGETFACGSSAISTVIFYAAENSSIFFIPFDRILNTCTMACEFHHRLIENMVTLIADKNQELLYKIDIISKKTLREKISAYLNLQSQKHNSMYFEIPLGRIELAEYLCTDRSALTRELNNMKNEGLIDFDKNTFRIL